MLLSGGRIDPQNERYLLCELPMARGQQYIHAYAVQQGAETVWLDESEDMFERVSTLWKHLTRQNDGQPHLTAKSGASLDGEQRGVQGR
jgi:hypothetical protein